MTDYYEIIGNAMQQYWGANEKSNVFYSKGIYAVLNNEDNYHYNMAFIGSNVINAQENFFSKYGKRKMFIYATKNSLPSLQMCHQKWPLKFMGKFPIIKKSGNIENTQDPSISINIKTSKSPNDFKEIEYKAFGVNKFILDKVYDRRFFLRNDFIHFTAYHEGNAVGKVSCAIKDDNALICNTVVLKEYEQYNIWQDLYTYLMNYDMPVQQFFYIASRKNKYDFLLNKGFLEIELVNMYFVGGK